MISSLSINCSANLNKSIFENMKQNLIVSSPKTNSEIIFFLGAGSSIPAGIEGVQGMVKEFMNQLYREEQKKSYQIITRLIQILEEKRQDVHLDINIEHLLEVIERIENSEQDILSPFYSDSLSLMTEIKNLRPNNVTLSTVIKNSIKQQTARPNIEVQYLKGLLDFLVSYKPLHIFSTNYDVVIERFCERYHKKYSDGFVKEWDTSSFDLDSNDVCIYKLHGSVTWSRSRRGRYSKNEIVIKDPEDTHTNIVTGDLEVPLILYPGKKLEYFEPVFDIFMKLKELISDAKYVFVLGYSFRDDHIRKLFLYAARRNSDLILLLITPSAYCIYENQLRYLMDEQFKKNSNNLPQSRSDLDGKVVCLPYELQYIMPYLKRQFLDNLKIAEELYDTQQENERRGIEPTWIKCLNYYSECEHIYKVDNIVSGLRWFDLVKENWGIAFKVAFETFFNSIPVNDNELIVRWRDYFDITCVAFQITSLKFIPMITPAEINLDFNQSPYTASVASLEVLVDSIDQIVLFLDKKLRLTNLNNQIKYIKLFYKGLSAYFKSWHKQKITYQKYYKMRKKNHSTKIGQLNGMVQRYMEDPAMQEDIVRAIERIEAKEMRNILTKCDSSITEYQESITQCKNN